MHYIRKDFLPLLIVELLLHARPGKERPAERDPDNKLTPRTRRLTGRKFIERPQRHLVAFGGAVNSTGPQNGMQAKRVLLERSAKGVAIGRKSFLDLNP